MKRLWWVLLAAACAGETPVEESGDPPCTGTDGTLSGTVVEDYLWEEVDPTPAALAKVQVRNDAGDSWEIQADEDGVFTSGLPEGTWYVGATNAGGDCMSVEEVTAVVEACQEVEVTVAIADCFDG